MLAKHKGIVDKDFSKSVSIKLEPLENKLFAPTELRLEAICFAVLVASPQKEHCRAGKGSEKANNNDPRDEAISL